MDFNNGGGGGLPSFIIINESVTNNSIYMISQVTLGMVGQKMKEMHQELPQKSLSTNHPLAFLQLQ